MVIVKPIKPVNPDAKFKWSALLDPTAVTPKILPDKAGIYVAVVCDTKGNPKSLPGEPPNSLLKGVVYIGMTGKNNALKKRFSALARAWRPNATKLKSMPHGSRGHYEKDPKAKKLFKPAEVRVQYMELPSDPKTEHQPIVDLEKKLGLSAGDFRKIVRLEQTGDKSVADMEAIKMQTFKELVGYIPILNRYEEGKGDRPPTDAEMNQILKNPETPRLK